MKDILWKLSREESGEQSDRHNQNMDGWGGISNYKALKTSFL